MRAVRRVLVVLLFALPFLVRLLYFLETRDQPYFQWNFLVAFVNHDFAADLAAGRGAPYALYRAPGYPLLVSWVYRLFGVQPAAVRILQWILGGASCLIVYWIGRRLLDRPRALTALVLAGLFVPAVCYEGELLEQTCAAFFALCALALLAKARFARRAAPLVVGASIAMGAGFLMRPDLILAAPLLLVALLADGRRRPGRAVRAALFAGGCLLMAIPLVRPHILINVRENDLAINAAINFYLGNNPAADGHDARFSETRELPTIEPDARRDHMTGLDLAGVRYATAQTGGGIATVAPYWRGKALAFITGHPVDYLRLESKKALLFFNGYLLGTQKDLYFMRDSSNVLRALLWCAGICVPLGLILPLAVVGLSGPGRTAAAESGAPDAPARLLLGAVPAASLATTLVFFHDARFLIPAAPSLILLAGSGLVSVVEAARARRPGPVLAVGALLVVSNADWLGTHIVNRAVEEFRVGTMYHEAGDLTSAGEAYRRAIEIDPGFVPALDNLVAAAVAGGHRDDVIAYLRGLWLGGRESAPLLRDLAGLTAEAGDMDAAIDVLRRGTARFPDDAALALDLAEMLMRRGSCDDALELLRRAPASGSREPRALAYQGYCLGRLGRNDDAVAALKEGLRRDPRDTILLGLLGQTYGALGRRDEEEKCYREILALDPRHAEAAYRLALSLAAQGRVDEATESARQAQRLGHSEAAALIRDLESRAPR